MFDTQGGDISIAAVTKCKEICLAVKKGTRRRGGVVQTRERRGDWGLGRGEGG